MEAEGNGTYQSTTSNLAQELKAIPVISSSLNFYNKVKNSNKVIRISLNYAEQNINGVLSSVTGTEKGHAVDRYLGGKMADLKQRFPVLQKAPQKVVKKVKVKSRRQMQMGASMLVKSFIGQFLIGCLDASVKVFEKTLGYLYDSVGIQRSKLGKGTSEKHVQTGMSPKDGSKNGEELHEFHTKSKEQKKQQRKFSSNDSSVMNVIIFPLVIVMDSLKLMQKYLYGLSGKTAKRRRSVRLSQKPPITPEKKAEIDSRRKVSPRKRLPSTSSVFTKFRNAASKLFGLNALGSSVKQTDIRQFITCSKHQNLNDSPVNAEDQKKRKHDEVLSEDESDTDEDILNMNLEDYISDEDPDYDVSEDESDSSDATITSEEEKLVDDDEITDINKEAEQMMKEKGESKKKSESPFKVRFETDKALAFTQNTETVKSPKNIKDVGKGQKTMDDKDVTKKTTQTKPDEAVKIQLRPNGSTVSQITPKPDNQQRPQGTAAPPCVNPKPEIAQQTWPQKK